MKFVIEKAASTITNTISPYMTHLRACARSSSLLRFFSIWNIVASFVDAELVEHDLFQDSN